MFSEMLDLQRVLIEISSQNKQDSQGCEDSHNNGFDAKAMVSELGACTAKQRMSFR